MLTLITLCVSCVFVTGVCCRVDGNCGSVCGEKYSQQDKRRNREGCILHLEYSVWAFERSIFSSQLAQQWEDTPIHFLRMDIAPLLSDSNIDEVLMGSYL